MTQILPPERVRELLGTGTTAPIRPTLTLEQRRARQRGYMHKFRWGPRRDGHIGIHWLQRGNGRRYSVAIRCPGLVAIDVRPSVDGWRAYHTAWQRARREQLRHTA